MMLTCLYKIPKGTDNIKQLTLFQIGHLLPLSTQRDINAAWTIMKKKAVKEQPEKFILDNRGVLKWNDGSVKILDKKITLPNFKKLNTLAEEENCTVNQMITKLIKAYKKK